MDLQLAGKTALITGGSKGIGKATAEVLAAEGCNLILVARGAAELDAAAASIRSSKQVNVRTIAADLSNDAAVQKVAAEAGHIDILVNNAGAIPPGDLLSIDDARWRDAWDLKVFGYISFCRIVYGQMKARKAGVIINVIGAAGVKLWSGFSYSSVAIPWPSPADNLWGLEGWAGCDPLDGVLDWAAFSRRPHAKPHPQETHVADQLQQNAGAHPAMTPWHASRTAMTQAAYILPYLQPGMRLLDVGCGDATLLRAIDARFPGQTLHGVDLSAVVVESNRGE